MIAVQPALKEDLALGAQTPKLAFKITPFQLVALRNTSEDLLALATL
jgi:hypothetical protein